MGKRLVKDHYLAGLAQSLREVADQIEQGQCLAAALVSYEYDGVVYCSCAIDPKQAAPEHLAAMGEEVNSQIKSMAINCSLNRQARLKEQVDRVSGKCDQSFFDLLNRAPE